MPTSIEKIFEDVQLHVNFTQASSRANIVTYDPTDADPENISTAFGKLSKWYEALVPTGGSSGQILGWNSSGTAKWINNTHSLSITAAASGDTSSISLSPNTKYKLTAGGSDFIFTSPNHVSVTKSADTTSTASPDHGGTFTTVDSVTRDTWGHVTKINTKTVTLPNDTSMTQTNTTGSADYRVLLSGNANDTTETTTGRKSTNLKFNPNTGVLSASSGVTTKTITRSALKGMLTGSGTAAQDKGSGVSPRYFPAKWTFNTGLTAANGDVFIIKLPTAGHSYGVFLSIDNGAHYYPISVSGTSRLTTHYGNGYSIAVMFKSDGSTADMFPLAGGDSRSTVTGGCWQVLNYYDSGNTNTKVNVTLGTTTKAYLLGTSTTPTSSAQAVTSIADTGVYLGTTAGSLYATTFYGSLDGNASKTGIRWNAVSQGQKWSRLYYSETAVNVEGSNGILSISCTRGNVVVNAVFLVFVSHSGSNASHIIELASTNYSTIRCRVVSNSSGSYYFEIYDTANNIASGTAQTWHCCFVTLTNATLTTYTTFTDGSTIPSNFAAANDFTTTVGKASAAIKDISRSGTTFTATRQDGSTFTFTQQDNNTTYSANNGVGLSGTTFYNSGVRAVSTGSADGTISVNTNGTSTDVAVKGLGTAAYKASSDFAVSQTLANDTNLNNITTPGFYNCGGTNSVTNKPSNVDAFGLNVIHDASGQWYTQILYPNNASPLIYVRNYNGSAWSGWNSIAIGSFLPLSGGTMTGTLTAKASQYGDEYGGALNMNNSNIYGVNAIYTADVSDNAAEGIHFYRDSTHVDTLWMNGGSLLFVPNRELGTSTTAANSQKVARFTANPTTDQVVTTDGTTGGIKSSGSTIVATPSGKVNTNWGTTSDRTTIVTKGWMSYWDGSYNGSASNLTYCNQGAFGTIVTKSTTDYSKVSISRNLTSGTKVGTITIDGTATDLYCQTNTNTDTKVTQSETTTANYRPIVFGATNSADATTLAATITDQTYVSTLLYAKPGDGILYANRMYLKAPGSKGQLNLLTSKYNVMLRNDDSNTYFLVTAQNDPTGTWTSARPLTINNSTGVCNINGNAATAGNADNANVTVTDVPSSSTTTSDPWYRSYGLLFAQNPNTTQSNTLRKSHNLRFYHSPNGTTDTVGVGELVVGNNTASGTAGNMQGRLCLYSSSSSYITMVPTATSSSVILTLPAVTGTVPSFTATPTSGRVVITDGTGGGVKSSSYTIATSVPSGALFTDQKVRQSATTTEDFRPILMGATHVSGSSTGLDATITDEAYVSTKLYCQPKTGNLYVAGDIKRSNNTLSLWSGNDCAGVSQRNNYDINTWYGFSVSNACTSVGTLNGVAFSVNARNGQAWHTGNVHLYSASGDSPALVFQRGTFVDNLNDWKIYVSGGELRFAQSTANASSETWTTKMYFHASDGNLYVGSTKVSLNGHTHSYIPLSGSTSVTGKIGFSAINTGIWLKDASGTQVGALVDNGSNLWIGAGQSTLRHHKGETFISSGWSGTLPTTASSSLTGNTTIKISVPVYTVDANGNGSWSHTGYPVLHSGNYTSYTVKKDGTGATGSWGISITGNATCADYVNVVASNEIRFYNDNQFKADNHFWLGYSWAAGSHYTPSGGSDTSSTTAPNITEFVMGNCTAGGLASVHAKTFILGNGSSPTKSSKTTTIATAATTTDRTITLPDDSGTVALTHKTFNVTRGSSVSTATTGYWAAMCNSSQTGSTAVLPTSGKWWHVISMDWTGNDIKNWISQLAIATQDGSGVWWRRNDTGGTTIDSYSWHRLAEGNSSGAATNVATEVGSSAGARPVFYAYLGDNTRVVYNTNFTYNPSGGVLTATTFNGDLSGNATTATKASKLSNTSAIGSSTQPVYFSASGVPVACTQDANGAHFSTVPFVRNDGVMEVGRYFDMHSTNAGTTDYDVRLDASGVSSFRFGFNTPASSSVAPSTNNQTSLGTSSLNWSSVYATNIYGTHNGKVMSSNIILRQHDNYQAGIGYDTKGNECIALWAKNTVTRLRWYAGTDMTTMTSGLMMDKTPDFEVSKADGSPRVYVGGFEIGVCYIMYDEASGTATTVSNLNIPAGTKYFKIFIYDANTSGSNNVTNVIDIGVADGHYGGIISGGLQAQSFPCVITAVQFIVSTSNSLKSITLGKSSSWTIGSSPSSGSHTLYIRKIIACT